MNYLSAGASHTVTTPILTGIRDQQILALKVVTQYSQNALTVTSFNISTLGSTNPSADLDSAEIYFTGNSNTFAAINKFGAVFNPSGTFNIDGSQIITGSQASNIDTNYFWLVYNIKPTAIIMTLLMLNLIQ